MLFRTDVDSLQQTQAKWISLPAFGAKQERPNHSVSLLFFTRNVGHKNLCPISHLSAYMKITETDRRNLNSNVLFLTCVSLIWAAACFTVVRWLTLVGLLRDAGAGGTAGSTRAAAATWAAARGVTTVTILQAAYWTSARTMRAHYLRWLPRNGCY